MIKILKTHVSKQGGDTTFKILGLDYKRFLFPAGEVGVKLDVNNYLFRHANATHTTIVARIQNSNDLVELAMVKDALERFDPDTPIHLFLPIVPYARQDRVCVPGESFSLKVFAGFINHIGFKEVTIVDPHSDVCGAVFDRVDIISQIKVVRNFETLNKRVLKGDRPIFVSPDAGANKKTSEIAAYFGHAEFVRADKLRNLHTGEIKETVVYADNLDGRDVFVADDLCDGGRTFTELAKLLKTKGAGKVILYVTHGIFTKGTKVLFENGIDEVYSTNSYYDTWPDGVENVTTMNLEETFRL